MLMLTDSRGDIVLVWQHNFNKRWKLNEWLLFITFLTYQGSPSLKPLALHGNLHVSDAFVPDPDYGLRGRNNEKIMKAWIGLLERVEVELEVRPECRLTKYHHQPHARRQHHQDATRWRSSHILWWWKWYKKVSNLISVVHIYMEHEVSRRPMHVWVWRERRNREGWYPVFSSFFSWSWSWWGWEWTGFHCSK